ncbi:hypothetical protein G7054_g1360 [Neopestalotiopsis clavispora]|nr:hypothetical protein G7054_g1360 [Neopestalotiopsis clavispora]
MVGLYVLASHCDVATEIGSCGYAQSVDTVRLRTTADVFSNIVWERDPTPIVESSFCIPPQPVSIQAKRYVMDPNNKSELKRNRSTLHVAFMSFVLASIPYGLATMLYYPLAGGGPVDVIWGWVLVSAIIVCVALSLGEITSIYPTAGGVYYQTFMLAPHRSRRVTAWVCGWLYVIGNIMITLSVNFGTTLFLVSCVNVLNDETAILSGEPYQVFVIFVAVTIFTNLVSSVGNAYLPWIDTFAILWTFAGILTSSICVLAIAKNGRRDAKFVFTHVEANSGWTPGWAFMVGLLHAAYATSSTGMIISMSEEVQFPETQVPKAMVMTVLMNTVAGILFLVPLMFVLPDLKDIIRDAQPVPRIIKAAVGHAGGTLALLVPLLVLGVICGIGCTTASARSIWAFSRDGAMPGSQYWRQLNRKLRVPLNAMLLGMVIEIAFGALYFGSTAAYNAFSGVGVICLNAAYAMPIIVSMMQLRRTVKMAPFPLHRAGYLCNLIAHGL